MEHSFCKHAGRVFHWDGGVWMVKLMEVRKKVRGRQRVIFKHCNKRVSIDRR